MITPAFVSFYEESNYTPCFQLWRQYTEWPNFVSNCEDNTQSDPILFPTVETIHRVAQFWILFPIRKTIHRVAQFCFQLERQYTEWPNFEFCFQLERQYTEWPNFVSN